MKHKFILSLLLLIVCLFGSTAFGQEATETDSVALPEPPRPVTDLAAIDAENDHGHAITLSWKISPDDGAGAKSVMSYEVFRWVPEEMNQLDSLRSKLSALSGSIALATENTDVLKKQRGAVVEQIETGLAGLAEAHSKYPEGGFWKSVGVVPSGSATYKHIGSKNRMSLEFLPDFCDLYFRVNATGIIPEQSSASEVVGPVQSSGQWFNTGRYPVLWAVLILTILTVLFVRMAKKGSDLYVRPLSGIEAVDDAIGRATEMGRPILYVLGLGSAADIATIASFTILGRVAKRVAEYQTDLMVPTYDPIVMSVAQEVVKSAFLDAGHPDSYNEDIVHFVTQSQFAYVAAVNGAMLRERPATNIYMGKFFAESLLLAETGAVAGSIQIAGTDEIAQIPFFIVACDYTLIGEELYAASAYLGREPILLGSLKAQDYAKAAVIILAFVGLLASSFGWTAFSELFQVVD